MSKMQQAVQVVSVALFIALGSALILNPVKITTPSIRASENHKALILAANENGVSPTLLLAISKIETAGTFSTSIRPKRKNGRFIGTARGLCQFIKKTARYYQLEWGTNDPHKQAVACVRLLNDNTRSVQARIGRKPKEHEIYLAHVFGAGKASRIIMAESKNSIIKTIGRRALNANRFLAKYKNAAGIRAWAERKIKKAKSEVRIYLTPRVSKTGHPKLWVNFNE